MELLNTIQQRNVLDLIWPLEDNSIDCCITSPPYWGLRDYGMAGQLGLEKTPEEYVENMVKVFDEVKRVLKPEGTVWLNLGDSYASGKVGRDDQQSFYDRTHGYKSKAISTTKQRLVPNGLKHKDLVGIPWKVAFALQAAGWYLRQDIIWHKPNPMPESVTDRCTKAHEYIFMLSKSPKYFYDYKAIRTPAAASSIQRWNQDIDAQAGSLRVPSKTNGAMKAVGGGKQRGHSRRHNGFNDRWDKLTVAEQMALGANKRSVWTVATAMYKDAHFATFPEELITPCVLAGCPKDGVVLDHFMGAGTTALVAKSHGRNYIGFELNPDYIQIAEKRMAKHFGMFSNI